ncbi:MAG TPA: helix-turn-helix domain-containing protein [Chloroflexia bacterium]|jgi:excisionase family DNA binding protein
MADLLNHVPVTASEHERQELHEIGELLGIATQPNATRLVGPRGEELVLPASLFQLLRQAVTELAHGQVVTLVSCNKELTTQQAANLLNVSRPYLIKLLVQGEIPFFRTGTHRRILFDDLMAYKARRDAGRRKDLAGLTQMSQELGLYDE